MDQYTTVTNVGYGSRIVNSLKGVIFGIVAVIIGIGLLYWNEGRVDMSQVAKKAVRIDAPVTTSVEEGGLFYSTGPIKLNTEIGDDLFLKDGKYSSIFRKAEMYSWYEEVKTEEQSNLGGSETQKKTYTYKKQWSPVSFIKESSKFAYPQGHENPTPKYRDFRLVAPGVTVNGFTFDETGISFPNGDVLSLNASNTSLVSGAQIIESKYVYVGTNASSTYASPQVGDMRLTYSVVVPETKVTIMGSVSGGNEFTTYHYKDKGEIFRVFEGTKEDAVAQLHFEFSMITWIIRLVGFLLIWIGLSSILRPITVLLDIIPFLASVSGFFISIIAFVAAVVISGLVIIVSMILHNIFAIIVVIILVVGAVIYFFKKRAKNKSVGNIVQS